MDLQLDMALGRHGAQPGTGVPDDDHELGREGAHCITNDDDRQALIELGESLVGAAVAEPIEEEENADIPGGYTYFGQFISHDMSFNIVSNLSSGSDARVLRNPRSPSLDLDSLYGLGPDEQPFFYRGSPGSGAGSGAGIAKAFILGAELKGEWGGRERGFDLPRLLANVNSYREASRAVIPDPRNDENRIVAQIHSVFQQLHNRQLAKAPSTQSARERFAFAQRETRLRYQWVLLHDYLPRIVGTQAVQAAMASRGLGAATAGGRVHWKLNDTGRIPLEFSVAAFRFGHSMVRPSYHLSDGLRQKRQLKPIPVLGAAGESMRGMSPSPLGWAFDWGFFFPGDASANLQASLRIDTHVSRPLFDLVAAGLVDDDFSKLPVRTLLRGAQLKVASGETVARKFNLQPLESEQLYGEQATGEAGRVARKVNLSQKTVATLKGRTPLWYYVLREAELLQAGKRLGPVGGGIVAEVLVELLYADPDSVVHQDWKPRQDAPETWCMRDLITEATGG